MQTWYHWQDQHTVVLNLHVQPGARKSTLAGMYGNHLKIRIRAPAIDNRANEELISFLAHEMDVPSRQIQLLQGRHGRHKRLTIVRPGRLLADMTAPACA
jgi:uncharacterized protein (TIGR00251 family)